MLITLKPIITYVIKDDVNGREIKGWKCNATIVSVTESPLNMEARVRTR